MPFYVGLDKEMGGVAMGRPWDETESKYQRTDRFPPKKSEGTDDGPALHRAIAAAQGYPIHVSPGTYTFPGGFVTSEPGVEIIGHGCPQLGPSNVATYGTIFYTATADAWTFVYENGNPLYNNYRGIRLTNLGFMGTADTAGGLWLQSNNNWVNDCHFLRHTGSGAEGFRALRRPQATQDPPETDYHVPLGDSYGTDDASWNFVERCFAQDCWNGFVCGEGLAGGSDAACHFMNCITLKTTNGGIGGTGRGFWIRVGNTKIIGGKSESNEYGVMVDADNGVIVANMHMENNVHGILLDRINDNAWGSRHRVLGNMIDGNNAVGGIGLKVGQHNITDTIKDNGIVSYETATSDISDAQTTVWTDNI